MAKGPAKGTLGHRLLNQKTGWQKALVAVTAIATAIIAVGGVIALILPLFRATPETAASLTPAPTPAPTRVDSAVPASGVTPTDTGVTLVHTQTAEADALVQQLISKAGQAPIFLNHKVLGKPGPADVTLYYACGSSGLCSKTRLQAPNVDGMAVLTDQSGVWFQGCFSVVKKGNGYGADYLDLALTKVGDACPT